MSRQSELAALARVADTGALSNRNLIINGAMQVAQRGTSFNAPADAGYTLDRISAFRNGAGVIDIEQSTVAPESFQYSLKVTVDTADTSLSGTDFGGLRYVVEGYDASRIDFGKSSAKQITLSFYARSSVTGIYSVAFRNSAASRSYAVDYTIDAVDTWERKEITITADTSGTWVTDSGKGIDLRFCLWGGGYTTAPNSWTNGNFTGSNNTNTSWIATVGNTFYITGVQLEVGDTATPFEHRSYGDELARCQRYFEIREWNGDNTRIGMGYCDSTTSMVVTIPYFVTKRVDEPTFTATGTGNIRSNTTGTNRNISSGTIAMSGGANKDNAVISMSSLSGSVGDGQGGQIAFVGAGSLQFDAEL